MRLLVYIVDADYAPVTGIAYGSVTTAGFRTFTSDGVYSATTPITLTSNAAVTAAIALGQWVEIGAGVYGVDVASGSHPTPGSSIEAVVTVTTRTVYATRHLIDDTVASVRAVTDLLPDGGAFTTHVDNVSYALTILAGVISNAGTASEQYNLTLDGVAYRALFAGLDTVGNRSGVTLSKP